MLVFIKKVFPTLMNMTMIEYVQLALAECLTTSYISIPRCPKGPTIFLRWLLISSPPIWSPNTLLLAILSPTKWCNVLLRLWNWNTSSTNLHSFQKILAYVKDEGSNLQPCVQVLKSCGDFDIIKPFDDHFFKHELSKVC